MLAQIAQAEMLITAEPQDADVVIINTCAFIEPARLEAMETIRQAVAWKRSGKVRKVIVAGCLPQRVGADLFRQADGIDAVVGLGSRDSIVSVIDETLASGGPRAYLRPGRSVPDDRVRFPIRPVHSMYLRLSEGCNRRCSLCTIPAIRGRFRSKPPRLVLAEARQLVSAGAVELNLIGQDITGYGRDLGRTDALAQLLRRLERLPKLRWLRLLYLYPSGITDRLIEAIAASDKITPYLDMPIQHINDDILRLMRRAYNSRKIRSLIEKLRTKIPGVVLRTTLIVGFPGETDARFEQLLDFIRWARFDALGCFKYYRESGTAAADMPGQVPEHIKDARLERLMLTQQQIAFTKSRTRLGGTLECLVDSIRPDGCGQGRFYGQAPEIDGVCVIKNCSVPPGSFVKVKVTDTAGYDLVTEQL